MALPSGSEADFKNQNSVLRALLKIALQESLTVIIGNRYQMYSFTRQSVYNYNWAKDNSMVMT